MKVTGHRQHGTISFKKTLIRDVRAGSRVVEDVSRLTPVRDPVLQLDPFS